MTKTLCRLVFVAFLFSSTGCSALIQDAVLSGFPTYEETESTMPSLDANEGRLIIYYGRVSTGGKLMSGGRTIKLAMNDKT